MYKYYLRELNDIYNVNRETAAMLMLCERLDRIADKLDALAEVCADEKSKRQNPRNGG